MLVDAMVYTSDALAPEDEALEQLRHAASLPGVRRALATPDIHTGFGVPIGSVVALPDIVVPSAVGYDINCGMRLMTTPLSAGETDVRQLADSIRRDIPLGEGKKNLHLNNQDLKQVLERGVAGMPDWAKRHSKLDKLWNDDEFESDLANIEDHGSMPGRAGAVSRLSIERGTGQLGTLGGGNHFIEIQKVQSVADESIARAFGIHKGQILVMIHSGSRGFGHQVGGDYMKMAAGISRGKGADRMLGFLQVESESGQNYISAMNAAANFAFVNRQVMALFVRKNLRHYFGDIPMPLIYDVPHNMAKLEIHGNEQLWMHRKGATRAFPESLMRGSRWEETGQPVIIPGSMGTASYLLTGMESGAESLFSVNHGAGRVMSRRAAAGKSRRRNGKVLSEGIISEERFRESMKGIYLVCEDRHSVKEEAPDAYKDIDEVIRIVTGAGLARLVCRMVPLAVLKG